ncbi:Ubiquitin-like protein MDY2 [Wickerhamomyces ciferrii]|uniref:Ubiquitin-like protein MDY2 n=1 Tax=Wickerhamomyces ciferrii (strain ATCC 14091 / BCRC 22168 / CBS 111 / JCM 3599 / NBRC 0793 / NRRL Y-1031 F-60-10) TaxID=1206466 RepID=K0KPL2_WICCF|nr:Ubiquitin-like protein MDY2 [Wickerhamomyces ciferrii]CCH44931.1 Ubiquitin-like protein MDY2 [Wickerhamomyces ciferrii]
MSQIQTIHSEKEFASNYLTLLSISDSNIVLEDSYKKDLKEIKTLGIKLPNLPNPKKSNDRDLISNGSQDGKLVNVTFKSIKPPRFNINSKINSNITIFKIKSDLIKSQNELRELDPSQLKFLVKGKVIQDSSLLSSILGTDEEITFTVMINKSNTPTPIPSSGSNDNDNINDDEPEISNIDQIKPEIQIPWNDIGELLKSKGLDSTVVISRLQKGWELTKN